MTEGTTAETGFGARVQVIDADITRIGADVIVNAANAQLAPGGGVCGAVHRAAGPKLAQECALLLESQGPCPVGRARLTKAYALPAKHVAHAVGPVWHGGGQGEADLLAGAYRACLELACEAGAGSISFPAISTGIFGYPPKQAASVAVREVVKFLEKNDEPGEVILCCFGEESRTLHEAALAKMLKSKPSC